MSQLATCCECGYKTPVSFTGPVFEGFLCKGCKDLSWEVTKLTEQQAIVKSLKSEKEERKRQARKKS
jgi:recombinational DNA repair protein (RecF pathway)